MGAERVIEGIWRADPLWPVGGLGLQGGRERETGCYGRAGEWDRRREGAGTYAAERTNICSRVLICPIVTTRL